VIRRRETECRQPLLSGSPVPGQHIRGECRRHVHPLEQGQVEIGQVCTGQRAGVERCASRPVLLVQRALLVGRRHSAARSLAFDEVGLVVGEAPQ
jgi:hypothetical protein